MVRPATDRSLSDAHRRLVKAREDLLVIEEQLCVLGEDADEARVRALVSDTTEAKADAAETRRHADAASRARAALVDRIKDLERLRDDLLERLVT